MTASASSRGVPPTAGVGCRRATSSSTGTGAARRPTIRVPRWATERNATSDGSAGTVSSSQKGASMVAMSSTT